MKKIRKYLKKHKYNKVKLNNTAFFLAILALILIVVFWRWFSFDTFFFGDWGYFYHTESVDYLYPSTWINLWNTGSFDLMLWRLPVNFLHGVFGLNGFDQNVSEKFIVLWPSLIIGVISSFILVKKITRSNLGGFVGAIVFNFNTYYHVSSHVLLYSAGAFGMLSVLSFIISFEKRKILYFLASIILLTITLSYDLRVGYLTAFVFALYGFYFMLINYKKRISKQSIKLILYVLISFILFLLLNLYWLLPYLLTGSLTSNNIVNRDLFGNEFYNILFSMSQYHPFWTGAEPTSFIVQDIKFYYWLIPIMAIIGLYLNRKNRYVLFFGSIALIGIFFTKQIGEPFSNIYPWLYDNLPGFNAFREGSKFYYLIAMSYAVLIGAFSAKISQLKFKKNKYKILLFAIALVPVPLFLLNLKPIFTGDIGTVYVSRNIPIEYKTLNNSIYDNEDYFRTLWIPRMTKLEAKSVLHPTIIYSNIIDDEWSTLAESAMKSFYEKENISKGDLMISMMGLTEFEQMLKNTSVRYVVLPSLVDEELDDIYSYYSKDKNDYKKKIDELDYLKRAYYEIPNLIVYENVDYKPHLYLTDELETIYEDFEYTDIIYEFVNPTEYKLTLNRISSPIYLNFSESYSSNWRLRIGNHKRLESFIKENYYLDKSTNIKNDANTNSFYIDPELVCDNYNCIQHDDGSYEIKITIYFSPQNYMYLGLVIGALALFFIISILVFKLTKKQ